MTTAPARARIRFWTLAVLAGAVIAGTSYLQFRITVLDGCNTNGDPGGGEVYLVYGISLLAGVVVGIVAARTRRWVVALAAALVTMVALMVLSWCAGNASFALIRAARCPSSPSTDSLGEACDVCRPPRPQSSAGQL